MTTATVQEVQKVLELGLLHGEDHCQISLCGSRNYIQQDRKGIQEKHQNSSYSHCKISIPYLSSPFLFSLQFCQLCICGRPQRYIILIRSSCGNANLSHSHTSFLFFRDCYNRSDAIADRIQVGIR